VCTYASIHFGFVSDFLTAASAKFHKVVHWAAGIRLFGCPANYNAETWESAHRWYVKRWLGKLQHSNGGSVKSLMSRNTIANTHGGSSTLDKVPATTVRVLRLYAVKGATTEGKFKRVRLYKYNVWVAPGHFLIISIVGATAAPTIGRLTEVRRKCAGHVILKIDKLRQKTSNCIMGRWTQVWEFVPGLAHRRIEIHTDAFEYDIDIFPMQPDFNRVDTFFSCSHMGLM